MDSRLKNIGGVLVLSAIVCAVACGCGSDSGGVIRPLPSNHGGLPAMKQHHPGQVVTPPAMTGQTSGAPNQGQ